MGLAMLELQLLALEIAAAYQFGSVTPRPAPWPKPSVTLITARNVDRNRCARDQADPPFRCLSAMSAR